MQHFYQSIDGTPNHAFIHRGPLSLQSKSGKRITIKAPAPESNEDVIIKLPSKIDPLDTVLRYDGQGKIKGGGLLSNIEWNFMGPNRIWNSECENVGPIDITRTNYMNTGIGPVLAVLSHPENSNVIYVATHGGVYKTNNANDSIEVYAGSSGGIGQLPGNQFGRESALTLEPVWNMILDSDPRFHINCISFDTHDNNVLYVGFGSESMGGCYVSYDGGGSWDIRTIEDTDMVKIYANNLTVLMISHKNKCGVYRSVDGVTFDRINISNTDDTDRVTDMSVHIVSSVYHYIYIVLILFYQRD